MGSPDRVLQVRNMPPISPGCDGNGTRIRPNRRLNCRHAICLAGPEPQPRQMTAILRPSVGLRLAFAAFAAVAASALVLGPARAQTPTLEDVRKHDQELEAVRAEQKKTLDSQKK